MSESEYAFLSDFFKTQKIKVERCLYPTMTCGQNAIRAHSIQNSRTIDLIQNNNKVYMMRMHADKNGPRARLDLVGRNQASTFTGLCSEHDASIFRPIDTQEIDPENKEQLFLIAYRSIFREYHAIIESTFRIQSILQKGIEDGKISPDEESPVMLHATEGLMRTHAFYKYKFEYFDMPYLRNNFDSIVHDVFIFEDQSPTISSSTFNSVDPIIKKGGFTGIVINVIPVENKKMLAIFSYISKEAGKARAALGPVLSATGAYQKYELSKYLLAMTENFAINPTFVNSWTSDKRSAIISAFDSTVAAVHSIGENHDFMLF